MADNLNCSKCKLKKKDDLVGCEGPCRRWWHHTCVKINDAEFKFLSKNNNVIYLCDDCKQDCDISAKQYKGIELEEMVSKNADKLKCFLETILNDKFSSLKATFDDMFTNLTQKCCELVSSEVHSSINVSSSNKTFASVTKTAPTIIITPKDPDQSSSSTKSQIYKNIDPVKENVIIKKVKNVNNGGIAVQCENGKDLKELITSKLGDGYDVKMVNPLNPRIRISGFTEKIDTDVFADMFKAQNPDVLHSQSHLKVLAISPFRKNSNLYQASCEVDAKTYINLMEHNHVIIGYDYCKVYDAIEVRRCFNCSGFHHLAVKCTSDVPVCPKCADNHSLSQCNSSKLKCTHCSNHNSRNTDKKFRTDHAVWDKSCKVHELVLDNLKRSILNIQ